MPKSKINVVATLHVPGDKMVVEMSFNTKLAPRHKFVLGLLVTDAGENADTLTVSELNLSRQKQILAIVDKIGELEFVDASEPIIFVDANVIVTLANAYIESSSIVHDMVQQIVSAIVNIVDPNCDSDDISLFVSYSTKLARALAVQEFEQMLKEEVESYFQDDGESDDAATDE